LKISNNGEKNGLQKPAASGLFPNDWQKVPIGQRILYAQSPPQAKGFLENLW